MSEPRYMWGDIFPPKGQRDFTEKDMVKVSALHLESQAEIVALRAENKALNEAVDNARHDSWGQAGVIEKLEARVAELEAENERLREALHRVRALTDANSDEAFSIVCTALANEGE